MEPELQYHIVMSFNNLEDKVQQDMYLRGQIVATDPTWVGTQGKGGQFNGTNRGKKNSTYKYYVTTGKFVGIFVLSMSWVTVKNGYPTVVLIRTERLVRSLNLANFGKLFWILSSSAQVQSLCRVQKREFRDWTIRRCVYTTSPWDYFLN